MKIWRLVSGILSISFFSIIMFQSGITFLLNAWDNNHKDTSDIGGALFAYGLLASGILSTALWKDKSKGGNFSLAAIYTLTALIGFVNLGTFKDLIIWSIWAAFCALISLSRILFETETFDNEGCG